jgi:copper chaperone CopZ
MKHLPVCLFLAAACLTGCFRPNNRVITVSVPQMKTQDCAARIVDSFKIGRPDHVDGVLSVVPNLDKKSVEVTFESLKLSIKNVEFTIANAGFDANDVKATEEARKALPPECK